MTACVICSDNKCQELNGNVAWVRAYGRVQRTYSVLETLSVDGHLLHIYCLLGEGLQHNSNMKKTSFTIFRKFDLRSILGSLIFAILCVFAQVKES